MVPLVLHTKNKKISVLKIDNKEFISLTDLARYADNEEPRLSIRDWMRSKEVISYLRLWESIHNDKFKGGEFDTFKNEAGSNTFKVTYQIQPKEGFDPNTLTIPDGEYDENLGWIKDIKRVGVLRYNEKTKTYSIDNYGTEW